jgi:hypothetical protein
LVIQNSTAKTVTSHRLVSVCLVAALLLCAVADVRTREQQVPKWSGPIDTISVAHQMLEAFFPEVKGHGYQMLIASNQSFVRPVLSVTALTSFQMAVKESGVDLPPMGEDRARWYLIGGLWEFTRDGDLDQMFLQGRANHYREYRTLLDEMSKHPTWLPGQLRSALADQGARFLPEQKREFLASVLPALEKLATLFGGTAKNVGVAFKLGVTTFDPTPPPPAAECEWEVEMEIVSLFPGRPTKKLTLIFDPIGGKLLHIIGVN